MILNFNREIADPTLKASQCNLKRCCDRIKFGEGIFRDFRSINKWGSGEISCDFWIFDRQPAGKHRLEWQVGRVQFAYRRTDRNLEYVEAH
ncbi:protein of unknown function [Burkholderia multivorans]